MKKVIILLLGVTYALSSYAQFNVNNQQGYIKLTDKQYNLDALILLNGIDNSTTIKYTGRESIEWRYTIDGSEYNSTQKEIIPESDILYSVYVNDSTQYFVYTLDYTQYLSQLNSLEIIESEDIKINRR